MIRRERLSATVERSLVVFLIRMRVNKPWKVHRWWPVAQAMPLMSVHIRGNAAAGSILGQGVLCWKA